MVRLWLVRWIAGDAGKVTGDTALCFLGKCPTGQTGNFLENNIVCHQQSTVDDGGGGNNGIGQLHLSRAAKTDGLFFDGLVDAADCHIGETFTDQLYRKSEMEKRTILFQ